jgi:hypothetical protein
LKVLTGLAALAIGLVAAGTACAQAVKLEIRPRIGDTLHLRYDQRAEASDGASGSMVSTLMVLSRTIVVGREKRGTDVLAVTDSVDMAPQSAEPARELLEGRPVHLMVAPDGATKLAAMDTKTVTPELRATLTEMPAMLPRKAIKVGRTWECDVQLPVPGGRGGKLKGTFRLDSLSRNGDLAYVSLRGTLKRDAAPPGGTGVVNGTLVVDRRRGWLTDSRATVYVTSATARMTITEWLRTTDR